MSFAVKPTIIGERVTLRPYRLQEDVDVLRALLRDTDVARLTGSIASHADPPPWDESAEQRMRAWYGSRHDQDDRLDLAVVDRGSGRCVGEVVLNEWDSRNRSCNLRIALAPAGQDRGLGTEATRLMVGYGFDELRLHRISLNVFDFNPRARRAYEKVGFVAEGIRRDVLRHDAGWANDTMMSVLAPEWEVHRGHPATSAASAAMNPRPWAAPVSPGGTDPKAQ